MFSAPLGGDAIYTTRKTKSWNRCRSWSIKRLGMAYPTVGQDAWRKLCGALITGQRANQDLSSLDDGTAKRGVRLMASVPAVCPSAHRIAAAPRPETRL